MTERQVTYMQYLAQGLSNREIAEAMNIKERTLYMYYQLRILMRTRLRKRKQLVEYAKQHYGEQTHG